MRFTQFLACCSLLVLCLHGSTALKCRTEEHQSNDQFQQVIRQCRDRLLQNDRRMTNENSASDNDSDGNDSYDDDDSSDSDERDSDKKSSNGRTGSTNTTMTKNSRSNNNGDGRSNSRRYNDLQTSSSRPYPYNYNMMSNSSSSRTDLDNERFSRNMTSRNGGSNSNSNGNNDTRSNQPDQACVVHCFFDELNLVDGNGFPEKSAVAKIMTQNIRDRELQNFIEEAVMGCFYMMNAVRNKERCKFSQNLLNCLASRGREKCEDWDYQQ